MKQRLRCLPVQRKILVAIVAVAVILGGAATYVFLPQTAAPERKILTLALEAGIENLSPPNYLTTVDLTLDSQVYDNLVEPDPQTLKPTPGLALSWEQTSDTTWVFKLRKGVKFQDGTPFNATAVKFTFDKLHDSKWTRRSQIYAFIEKVDVVDDYAVRITTKGMVVYLPWALSAGDFGIVSPTAAQKWGDQYGRHPVGAGPFMVAEFVEKEFVKMVAFDEYWRGKPKLGGLLFKMIPLESARLTALLAGDVDLIANPPTESIPQLEKDARFQILNTQSNRMVGVFMSALKEPLTDVKVRRAIHYAVDRDAIMKNIVRNLAPKANTALGPFTFGKLPNDFWGPDGKYPYDANKAKSLLDEAGWKPGPDGFRDKDGKKLSVLFRSPIGRYLKDKEIAEALVPYWKAVGIDVKLETLEPAAHFAAITKHEVPMYILGWGWQAYPEPFFSNLLHSYGKDFAPWVDWKNKQFDTQADAASAERDEAKRLSIYNELEKLIIDEGVIMPFYYKPNLIAAKSGVKDVQFMGNEVLAKMLSTRIED